MSEASESKNSVNGWRKWLLNRRNFFGLGAAGGLGAFYMRCAEAEWLEVNEPRLELKRDGEELRILHLSDFHASDVVSMEYIRRAVELGVALKPDLVCLTGDFITTRYEDFGGYLEAMKILRKAAPAFACVGNHDGGSWIAKRHRGYKDWSLVAEMLSGAGIKFLHNEGEVVEVNGRALQLVGMGDLWAEEIDGAKAFDSSGKELKTVVLSHNPDSKDLLRGHRWDLMLSGHTHGGQMWVPGLGAPFAPVRDKRYVSGLRAWGNRWIHVTKGIGNLHGLRLNCRPEVSLLRVIL